MRKTMWWLRIVGVFYLLLTLMNLYFLFIDPKAGAQMYRDILPPPVNDRAITAFMEAWLVFVFELGVLGVMALYASRMPEKSGVFVWTIVLAELFRGAVADAIWIAWGYSAASYIPFIIIHLLIIATGLWFWKQESGRWGA